MRELQQHGIQLGISHPSSAQGWRCPMCGPRLLIHLNPEALAG